MNPVLAVVGRSTSIAMESCNQTPLGALRHETGSAGFSTSAKLRRSQPSAPFPIGRSATLRILARQDRKSLPPCPPGREGGNFILIKYAVKFMISVTYLNTLIIILEAMDRHASVYRQGSPDLFCSEHGRYHVRVHQPSRV